MVLIAAVALALRLCSRVGPQLRFAVWAMTFIVLLATPLLNLQTNSSPSGPLMAGIRLSATWEYAIAMLWVILMTGRWCSSHTYESGAIHLETRHTDRCRRQH